MFSDLLPPCAKGKPISRTRGIFRSNRLPPRWTNPIESIPQETCDPGAPLTGPATFEELQNYIARASFSPLMASLKPAPIESYEQSETEISNPPSKTRCVEKFWLLQRQLKARSREEKLTRTWLEAHHSVLTNEAILVFSGQQDN